MPTCKRCGRDHYNFLKECPPVPEPVPMAGMNFGEPTRDGKNYWGKPWGDAPKGARVEVVYNQPFRQRTGSLVMPDTAKPES